MLCVNHAHLWVCCCQKHNTLLQNCGCPSNPSRKGKQQRQGPVSWRKTMTSSQYGAGTQSSVLFSLPSLTFLLYFPPWPDTVRTYIKHCALYKQLYRESSMLSSLECDSRTGLNQYINIDLNIYLNVKMYLNAFRLFILTEETYSIPTSTF